MIIYKIRYWSKEQAVIAKPIQVEEKNKIYVVKDKQGTVTWRVNIRKDEIDTYEDETMFSLTPNISLFLEKAIKAVNLRVENKQEQLKREIEFLNHLIKESEKINEKN